MHGEQAKGNEKKTSTSVFWKRELFPEKGFAFIFPETVLP